MSSEQHDSTRKTLMLTTAVTAPAIAIAGFKLLVGGLFFGFALKTFGILGLVLGGIYFFYKSWTKFSAMEYSTSQMNAFLGSIMSLIAALMSLGVF